MDRLETELELVRSQFGTIRVSPSLDWVVVERFAFPANRFNRSVTELLHFVKPGYPQTPPDNFFVPTGLRTASEGELGKWYHDGVSHFDRQWGQFSWHAKVWKPTAEMLEGDNLCTFLLSILRELETYSLCN